MTTHTTATAAHLAKVTTATIREWIRIGAVVARKVAGRWAIDADSLNTRLALGAELAAARRAARAERIARHADLTPYKDQARAYDKVVQLLEDEALVPAARAGIYTAISSDGTDKYLVDAHLGQCDCKAHQRLAYCTHLTAAQAIEAAKPARPHLALVA